MEKFRKILKQFRGYSWIDQHIVDQTERYLETGDTRILSQISGKNDSRRWLFESLSAVMASPDKMTDADKFVLHGMAFQGFWQVTAGWLDKYLAREKPGDDLFLQACREMTSQDIPKSSILKLLASHLEYLTSNGIPNSAGRYILSLSDSELGQVIYSASATFRLPVLLPLLLDHASGRVPSYLGDILKHSVPRDQPKICNLLLVKGGEFYEPHIYSTFREAADPVIKLQIGIGLSAFRPERYNPEVLEIARGVLERNEWSQLAGKWMIDTFGVDALPYITDYIRRGLDASAQRSILSHSVNRLGKGAAEAVITAINSANIKTALGADMRVEALGHLVTIDDGVNRQLIIDEMRLGFLNFSSDTETLLKYLNLASRWDVKAVQDNIWPLAEHKSVQVRESAARTLGKLGDEAVTNAAILLKNKKADIRLTAVKILASVETPSSQELLESQLTGEDADDVREAILFGLQRAWDASGKRLTKEDVERWASLYEARNKWPPVSWLNSVSLPQLKYTDGSSVPEQMLRYLLSRQARSGEVRPLLELKPLYEAIDRKTSSDFALELLQGFIASGADVKDKWVLVVSSLLGDEQLVPVMTAQIKEWADGSRNKLAEYAVQVLALVGTDNALLAVDSLAIRYRTKVKNVGNAAVEAFSAAAESLGITSEELGDRVVPWLGFEPGKPRIIEASGKRVAVRIGPDFRLLYQDLAAGKKVASLPSGVPQAVKDEFKALTAALREISKAQILRMENLMVCQHRWPVERWKELFLGHPLLTPFGIRLVWGAYNECGELQAAFRTLEDGTLTDRADNEVTLSTGWTTGILHPLEIDEEARQEWLNHLTDYEIQPPFAQMDRPVVCPSSDELDAAYCVSFLGTTINAMTFKGRAERMGWRRGSVCDAGSISTYMKSFSPAGVDAFLFLEGMYVGIDMYSEITLGSVIFTTAGTVKIGSYEYDEPSREDDPRLIPFGKVPPVVFSEVMGSLKKIAGTSEEEADPA